LVGVEGGLDPRQASAGLGDALTDLRRPHPAGRLLGQVPGMLQGVVAEINVGTSGQGFAQVEEVLRQAAAEQALGVEPGG
jgi:hypothetical protein